MSLSKLKVKPRNSYCGADVTISNLKLKPPGNSDGNVPEIRLQSKPSLHSLERLTYPYSKKRMGPHHGWAWLMCVAVSCGTE